VFISFARGAAVRSAAAPEKYSPIRFGIVMSSAVFFDLETSETIVILILNCYNIIMTFKDIIYAYVPLVAV